MPNWKEYRRKLAERIGGFAQSAPDTVQAYQALAQAHAGNGVLDSKTRELIALAVAVTTRCDGCIASHAEAARKAGASAQEVAEALSVAIAMNAGAALVYSTRALEAFAEAGKE